MRRCDVCRRTFPDVDALLAHEGCGSRLALLIRLHSPQLARDLGIHPEWTLDGRHVPWRDDREDAN